MFWDVWYAGALSRLVKSKEIVGVCCCIAPGKLASLGIFLKCALASKTNHFRRQVSKTSGLQSPMVGGTYAEHVLCTRANACPPNLTLMSDKADNTRKHQRKDSSKEREGRLEIVGAISCKQAIREHINN